MRFTIQDRHIFMCLELDSMQEFANDDTTLEEIRGLVRQGDRRRIVTVNKEPVQAAHITRFLGSILGRQEGFKMNREQDTE